MVYLQNVFSFLTRAHDTKEGAHYCNLPLVGGFKQCSSSQILNFEWKILQVAIFLHIHVDILVILVSYTWGKMQMQLELSGCSSHTQSKKKKKKVQMRENLSPPMQKKEREKNLEDAH